MEEISFGLPPNLMRDVFPFHIVFDRDLKIRQLGPAIKKPCPYLEIDQNLGNQFKLVTPDIPFEFESICQQLFTVFFIEYKRKKIVLKGQMAQLESNGVDLLVFLCSPVVRDMGSISELGITLNDFAIHDSVVDFLVLLQTKINAINDVRKMADRLKQEVSVRREAESQLKDVNENLEGMVGKRTAELKKINKNLKTEIKQRKKADEELRLANIQLKSWVEQLEQRNREISTLNKMGDRLQACRNVTETYDVIVNSIQKLFPDHAGMVCLHSELDGKFETVASWGDLDCVGDSFTRSDCRGLRRARIHQHEPGEEKAACNHLRTGPKGGYICAPLMVRGELLGIVHIQSSQKTAARDADGASADARNQLIQTASEHISLAIANLKLQESLRIQSIRDPLTGLYNRRHMEASLEREVARATRGQKPVGIIMLDVDHFKRFNDDHGHEVGDVLLSGFGKFLLRHVRDEDIACRYGGEEFILILPGASAENTHQRAEQIRKDVEQHLRIDHKGKPLPQITISLGSASFPANGKSSKGTVHAADTALYQAKESGRNLAMRAGQPE